MLDLSQKYDGFKHKFTQARFQMSERRKYEKLKKTILDDLLAWSKVKPVE